VPDSEFEQYRRVFEDIQRQTPELIEGMDEARFNWRPGPDQWSIEECLAHLTVVGQWEIRALEEAIDQAHSRGLTGKPPFHYGPLDRYIVALTDPSSRRKFTAPRRFSPIHGQPTTAIVPTFLHLQSQFLLQLDRAQGLDWGRVKVATPISSLFKISLGMTFAQVAAHERRHMEQAQRVRQRLTATPQPDRH